MIELKFFSDFEDAISFCHELGDQVAPEISKALNRALAGIKTDAIRKIVKDHGVAREEAKLGWDIFRSSPGNLEGTMASSGKRPGLEAFDPNPRTPMLGVTTGGVTINIRGTSVHLPKAFMGLKTTDPTRVLRRAKSKNPESRNNNSRYRLRHLTARAIPQIVDDDDVVKIATQGAEKRFVKQFDHLIGRLIQDHK